MKATTLKYLSRLLAELAMLLGLYLLGCQLAAWLAWPIPGGVIGMVLLLLALRSAGSSRRRCKWAQDC